MAKDQITIRDLDESDYEGPASIQNFVSDEGWEFNPGVPDRAEDGWFSEDLGVSPGCLSLMSYSGKSRKPTSPARLSSLSLPGARMTSRKGSSRLLEPVSGL